MPSPQKRLRKLLWQQSSGLQLSLGAVALVLGMVLLMVAWQLYQNAQGYLEGEESNANFLVLNKEVSVANTLFMASNTFTKEEIESLEKQRFINKVAPFRSSQFEASIYSSSFNFYTHIFFEALPNSFLDKVPEEFETWNEGDPVPLLISRDFLNLYNFGFALSRGLPQLSESSFKMLDLTLRLRNKKGQQKDVPAKVVGFTSRVSSLLVPLDFLEQANERFGDAKKGQGAGRLIVQVEDKQDPKLQDYLAEQGYHSSQELTMAKRADRLATSTFLTAISLGLLFMVLAFVLFVLIVQLNIAEAKKEISLLLQLGYRKNELSQALVKPYITLIALLFFLSASISYALVAWVKGFLKEKGISLAGFELSTPLLGLLVALVAVALVFLTVKKLVRKASN